MYTDYPVTRKVLCLCIGLPGTSDTEVTGIPHRIYTSDKQASEILVYKNTS